MGKERNKPPTDLERAGLQKQSVSHAQEVVPLPYLAGERKMAVKWISRVYNLRAKEAPDERPGKK